eukprot:171193_1
MALQLDEADTTKSGEGNGLFDFERWVCKYSLTAIKDCFVENDMTTLNTLNMDNDNFSKLMQDQRVLGKAHLIPNIIKGIRSLKEKQKEHEAHQLVFMTESEHAVFSKTQDYIDELCTIETELNSKIKIAFESKKQVNAEILRQYKQNNLATLDQMSDDIDHHFAKMYEALKRKQNAIKIQINECKTKVNDTETKYDQMIDSLDQRLQDVFSLIDDGTKYYNDSITQYKTVCKQHHDAKNKFNVKSNNNERETAICNIGKNVAKTHDLNRKKPSQNMDIIRKFINAELRTANEQLYSLETDDAYTIVVDSKKSFHSIKTNRCLIQKFIKTHQNETKNAEFVVYQHGSEEKENDMDPPYIPHMTIEEASQLKVGDKVDHMENRGQYSNGVKGRFYEAMVAKKKGTNLKIHYDDYSQQYDVWSDYQKEIHRFATLHSITLRPAHRLKNLGKGSLVDINPAPHPGWKSGKIVQIDGGQVKVRYKHDGKTYYWRVHVDDADHICHSQTKVQQP